MRQCRGLASVIVAGEEKHPAVGRRAGGVAVLEDIAAAVDPRSLAVPQCKYAVVFSPGEEADLLTTPNRRGAELLIDRRLKADVVAIEKPARAP
jgi:hypothetical protein